MEDTLHIEVEETINVDPEETIEGEPEEIREFDFKAWFKKALKFVLKWFKILFCISLVYVFIVTAIGVSISLSSRNISRKYAKAYFYNNIKTMARYSAEDLYEWVSGGDEDAYFEKCSDIFREDIDSWGKLSRVQKRAKKDQLFNEYGSYRVRIKVTREEKISVDSVSHYKYVHEKVNEGNWLERFMNKPTKAMKITVKARIKGEERIVTEVMEVTLVKGRLLWKVLDIDKV